MNMGIRPLLAAVFIGFGSIAISALPALAAEETMTIPGTSAEIWKAIDTHLGELRADIKKGALKNVHKHAFAIRDLVRGLPHHSPELSAEALAKVTSQVKFVDTLAERLDQTGDANDKAGTEDNLAKLEATLKSIRANYPAAK